MSTTTSKQHKSPQLYAYVTGFVLSVICTLVVYGLVVRHAAGAAEVLSYRWLVATIMAFAMVQLVVQLVFFLHLGREQKPKWNTYALLFTGLIVAILVAGTLWIMANLDYTHGHSTTHTETEIIKDEGFDTTGHDKSQ